MGERNEKPLFEGQNRRTADRRQAERRKSAKFKTILKYIVIIVVTTLIIKVFKL